MLDATLDDQPFMCIEPPHITREQAEEAVARRVSFLAVTDTTAIISGRLVDWDEGSGRGRARITARLKLDATKIEFDYIVGPPH